jgi:hypothetical protein
MKLTKRGEYARTLIRLGIADRQVAGVISVSTLTPPTASSPRSSHPPPDAP